MLNFTQTTYIEIKINNVTFIVRDRKDSVIWTETFVVYNLKTTGTNIQAVHKSNGHSFPMGVISCCDLGTSAVTMYSELLSASQNEGDEDAEGGLWSALNLDRCSGHRLSCGALPSAPEASHRVPSALLTFVGSRLAGP